MTDEELAQNRIALDLSIQRAVEELNIKYEKTIMEDRKFFRDLMNDLMGQLLDRIN